MVDKQHVDQNIANILAAFTIFSSEYSCRDLSDLLGMSCDSCIDKGAFLYRSEAVARRTVWSIQEIGYESMHYDDVIRNIYNRIMLLSHRLYLIRGDSEYHASICFSWYPGSPLPSIRLDTYIMKTMSSYEIPIDFHLEISPTYRYSK